MFSDEVLVTMSRNFGQVCQDFNNCPEEQSKEKPFSTEINLLFLKDSELTRFFH